MVEESGVLLGASKALIPLEPSRLDPDVRGGGRWADQGSWGLGVSGPGVRGVGVGSFKLVQRDNRVEAGPEDPRIRGKEGKGEGSREVCG